MTYPRNKREAIAEIVDTATVDITIHCQVEDFANGCDEYLDWRGEVGAVEELLVDAAERRGWQYRHHPDRFGFQQWICEECAVREADRAIADATTSRLEYAVRTDATTKEQA